MAPGLRHLEAGRRHARAPRHEHRRVSRRRDGGKRPPPLHTGQPQTRRDRRRTRLGLNKLPAVDAGPRDRDRTRRARRLRGADGPGGQHVAFLIAPRSCEPAQHFALRPHHRLPLALPRREPHPQVPARGMDRASRLRPDRAPGRRLPDGPDHRACPGGGVSWHVPPSRAKGAGGCR